MSGLGLALASLTHLRHLDLSENAFGNIQYCRDILSSVQWCKRLQVLKLSSCGFTEQHHVDIILSTLQSLCRITDLTLSKNQFSIDSLKILITGIKLCHQLMAVDLRYCHTGLEKKLSNWHAGEECTSVEEFCTSLLQHLAIVKEIV